MKRIDQFKYCEIQSEYIEIEPDRYEDIGIDLRSLPVDSQYDRVCCRCGESLSVDGKCDYCGKVSRRNGL